MRLGGALLAMAVLVGLSVAGPSAQAAFAGQNGKIAFVRGDIYTMNADGSGQSNLTNYPARYSDPTFSPDGQKIAFASNRGHPFNTEIYVMNADGSDLTRLTDHPYGDFDPAFSPDGRKLAFTRSGNGIDIYTMNADGSGVARLTSDENHDFEPAFSPDGHRIAFRRETPSLGALQVIAADEIYSMNPDGSGETNLTNTGIYRHNFAPAFSPDGQRLAFNSGRNRGYDNQEIYVMNADGSGQIPLTDHPSDDREPAFSPDGQKIAFARNGSEIYTMNADGSGVVRLTAGDEPDWGALRVLPAPPPAPGATATPPAGRPGKCSKLKGKKRRACVRKRCGRLKRGKLTKRKKARYRACVKKVTRRL